MASIQERKDKNGKITGYRIQIRIKGHPAQTATFERKTDAKLWAQETESAMRRGLHFKTSEAKKHTLGDLIDRYIIDVLPSKQKCINAQKPQLLWWKKQIGSFTLAEITPALIVEQRDRLGRENTKRGRLRSPSTVVRYLAVLSHAFTIAIKDWGWMDDSPMRKVTKPREPRGRVRFLSDNERRALLSACQASQHPLLYPVVVVALSTGMRQAEIMNLKWPDIDLARGRLILHETKNGERRGVPITGHALELLKRLDRTRCLNTTLLFPSAINPYKPIDLRFHWEKAIKTAGIDDFRFHDLRHSAASYLAMSGASINEIADVLGHKTLAMAKRYSHLTEDHKGRVVARMNEQFVGDER